MPENTNEGSYSHKNQKQMLQITINEIVINASLKKETPHRGGGIAQPSYVSPSPLTIPCQTLHFQSWDPFRFICVTMGTSVNIQLKIFTAPTLKSISKHYLLPPGRGGPYGMAPF